MRNILNKNVPSFIGIILGKECLTLSSFAHTNQLWQFHLKKTVFDNAELCNTTLFNHAAINKMIRAFQQECCLQNFYMLFAVDSQSLAMHQSFHFALFSLRYQLPCIEIVSTAHALEKGIELFEHLKKDNEQRIAQLTIDERFLESLGLYALGKNQYEKNN